MDRARITIENIEKHYGPERVLGPISLCVSGGEIVGIVGANGAGKSTLLRILAGAETPDGGSLRLENVGADAIGYVPQELALYESLTGRQNLSYWAAAAGVFGKQRRIRVRYLLELVNLTDKADKPVSSYSGGMKRRLNLACALIGDVKLLLLDEPTVGADAASVELMLDAIKRLAERGCAVLLVSHHMHEIERLCTRTVELRKGRIEE
ncbi:MAG: ABC transporter ATP-binding protein [Clostridia bacterium]|nr:ABC transporter ATP-binding protein [Clostridia bacterium]